MGPTLEPGVPIRIEELLRHAGWLRKLAGSLVRDPGSADDLVQETWLAALRRPPLAGASPRPWLERVFRNLARNRHRSEHARSAHEGRAEERGADPTPDGIAQEVEAQRLLAEAVARLAEPARTIVVLRYFRGLDSTAIGRELALPAGTVRWRLQTALEELRRELDRRFVGGRRAWSLVLARLLVAPAPAAALPWATLAAAGLLALGLGWWILRPRGADPRPEETIVAASARLRGSETLRAPLAAEPGLAPASESRRVPLQPSAATHEARVVEPDIEGQVLVDGAAPGRPVAVRVRFHTQPGWLPGQIVARNDVRKLVTDDFGRFDVSVVGPGCTFGLQAPGFVLEADQPGEWETPAREIVLRLRTAPALRGRVVDPSGEPVPGATGFHWLHGKLSDSELLLDPTELLCDRDGRFEIPLLGLVNEGPADECEGTLLLEVPHVGRKLVETGPFPLADRDLGEIRLEPVRVLTFRVRDPHGVPLSGAVARLDDHWLSKPSSPTNGEGYGGLRQAPQRTVPVRFSAFGCVDQVLAVGVGEVPEVWLAPATVLEIQLEPPANHNGPFPRLVLSAREPFVVHPGIPMPPFEMDPNWIQTSLGATPTSNRGLRRERGVFEAWCEPDRGGRARIVGLRPGVPLVVEARDEAQRFLGSAELALDVGETRRLDLFFAEPE